MTTVEVVSESAYFPTIENVLNAERNLRAVVSNSPLMKNLNLSARYSANIQLKREDLQIVRSYKIRGAYNKIISLSPEELKRGVVCASAGNHAQGVAYSCNLLGTAGTVFMPLPTPKQKIRQVKMFGKDNVEVVIAGDSFDEAYDEALKYCEANQKIFIHPFDDPKVIEGQGTIALEILKDEPKQIDYLFVPIGGGGLLAGVSSIFKKLSPVTKIIGVEPLGAAAMKTSFERNENTTLEKIDKFVDGAAVKRVGDYTFNICRQTVDDIATVPEGKVCTTILKLYDEDAIVVEPAGALSIAALDYYADEIVGKTVVCIVSGSNNDITRMEDIKERSLLYEGLKHYFIIRFPQRAGALKEFLQKVLGPTDDIAYFQYSKKNSREQGPAIVGLEVQHKEDFDSLLERMNENKISYEYLNDKPDLFQYVV